MLLIRTFILNFRIVLTNFLFQAFELLIAELFKHFSFITYYDTFLLH